VFYHASRKTFRQDVFKVSASISEAATFRLGLISDKILNVSVSKTSVLGLVSVLAQKVSCTSLLTDDDMFGICFSTLQFKHHEEFRVRVCMDFENHNVSCYN